MEAFRTGSNCAQAVLGSFGDETGLDGDAARRVAAGFGGGMGRLQRTCGAVTGAFMVLGFFGRGLPDAERKEWVFDAVQRFDARFRALHGTVECRSLLGCDLRSAEGRRRIEAESLLERVCEPCVTDAVSLVEELAREQSLAGSQRVRSGPGDS